MLYTPLALLCFRWHNLRSGLKAYLQEKVAFGRSSQDFAGMLKALSDSETFPSALSKKMVCLRVSVRAP